MDRKLLRKLESLLAASEADIACNPRKYLKMAWTEMRKLHAAIEDAHEALCPMNSLLREDIAESLDAPIGCVEDCMARNHKAYEILSRAIRRWDVK